MALCAYQTSNNYEHVIYVGLDNHVHELIYTGQWRHNDLTTAAKGAPPAAPGSALAGYQTSNNNEHVIYINTHVYELIYTDHWAYNDVTKAATSATAPPADQGSALAGYQTSNNNEHVIFVGEYHVNELVYTDHWANNDLGGPNAGTGSGLAGYQSSNNNEHVNYIGFDNHVHELVYTGQWRHNDLTTAANGAPPADPESGLAGYQTSNNNLHVNYISVDHHVHELVYTDDQWRHNDLTTAANGAPPAALSSQ